MARHWRHRDLRRVVKVTHMFAVLGEIVALLPPARLAAATDGILGQLEI